MSTLLLHHQRIENPERLPARYMLVLHGIFGVGRNWFTHCTQLARVRPQWGFILVDLRLHGRSQGFPPPHTLERCADDLQVLVERLALPVRGIMGHSFGGKVAMVYAQRHGEQLDQTWILDSTPEKHRSSMSVVAVLEAMKRLPMPQPSRQAVVKGLLEQGLTLDLAQWLSGNAELQGGQFVWRFDFPGLEALLLSFYETELWSVLEEPPFHTQVHVVKAERSQVLSEEGEARAHSATANGRTFLHILPDAGHWLHVDNPRGLLELMELYT